MIFFAVALLLVGNVSSFKMPRFPLNNLNISQLSNNFIFLSTLGLSRRQSSLMMDPLGSDSNLVTPKSIADSAVMSRIKRFPMFAGPIVGVIAASISKVLAEEATGAAGIVFRPKSILNYQNLFCYILLQLPLRLK